MNQSFSVASAACCLLCGQSQATILYTVHTLPLFLHAVAPEWQSKVPCLPFRLGVCGYCGHIQQVNTPSPDEIRPIYTTFFESYQSTAQTGIGSLRARRFLDFLAANASLRGRVLEVGCFDGFFLSLLRDRGCDVIGCDPSPGADIAARQLGIKVLREFFRKGLFTDSSFDVFIARQLLEHIRVPRDFLETAYHLLSREGVLALEVPDADLWFSNGVMGSLLHEHVSYFTASTIRNLVESAGFEIVSLEHRHTDLFLVARKCSPVKLDVRRLRNAQSAKTSRQLVLSYSQNLYHKGDEIVQIIEETHRKHGEVVLYGAGVHSSSMVAALGLTTSQIDCVVDDNPAVQSKVLPNLSVSIESSDLLVNLAERDVVIISGFSYQEEMLERLEQKATKARVVQLYPKVRCVL